MRPQEECPRHGRGRGDPREVPRHERGETQVRRKDVCGDVPPLRTGKEFLTQQAFGRLKAPIKEIIGVKFQLCDDRRTYGQRMLDSGYKLELVSRSMGHDTVVTTQKYYTNFSESQVLEEIFERKNGIRT